MRKLLFCCLFVFSMLQTGLMAQSFNSEKLDSLFHLLEDHDTAMGSLSVYYKDKPVYPRTT